MRHHGQTHRRSCNGQLNTGRPSGGWGGQACSTPAALYWAHLRALLPKHAAPGGLRRAGSG